MSQQRRTQAEQLRASIRAEQEFERPIVVRYLNFRDTVAVAGALGSGVRLTQRSPVNGYITHVTFHFPGGCVALVRVRVLVEREGVWPIGGEWIALDTATPVYNFPPPGQAVKKNDYLEVELENTDGTWIHTISVILTVEGTL